MRQKLDQRGGVLTGFLSFLFLIYFGLTVFLFFLYREGIFRFEFGKKKEEVREMVVDKNRVLELIRKEKFLKEELGKITLEKKLLQDLRRQIEIEKKVVLDDKKYISEKMEEISSKFQELSEGEEKRLRELASLYNKMKAQRVATIFKELDIETVAKLLVRMQDKASAKVLGEIGVENSKRAAAISDMIQGKMKKSLFAEIPGA